MSEEGYIKFSLELHDAAPPELTASLRELNETRTKLHELSLVGVLDSGIGYGNVSIKTPEGFIISGSATGALPVLSANEYCLVTSIDPEANSLVCYGPIKASSESMSHGAIYGANPKVGSVLHIHSRTIFDFMAQKGYAATSVDAQYGTPEMALELEKAVSAIGESEGIIVMLGHDEGVIAFGETVPQAYQQIISVYDLVNS